MKRNVQFGGRVLRVALVVSGAACGLLFLRSADAQASLEYEVKAAFLLNFAKFVEWPANAFSSPNSPLAICILGKDPFGRALDEIVRGERIGGHPAIVRRMAEAGVAAKTCQIAFIAAGVRNVPAILRAFGPGVLTVGEQENFLVDGGVIRFAIENRRVRFDINRTAAQGAGLRLSSQLLMVARSIEER
jgi:YfiR/HmsC-like